MSSMYYIQGLEFINDSSQNLRPPNLKTVHGTVIRNHTQNLEMLSDSVTGLGTKPGLSRLGAKPWHARETGHGLGGHEARTRSPHSLQTEPDLKYIKGR